VSVKAAGQPVAYSPRHSGAERVLCTLAPPLVLCATMVRAWVPSFRELFEFLKGINGKSGWW
jgi:hypothetical protein